MRPSINHSPKELIEMSREGKAREVWELVSDESNGLLALLNLENPMWFSEVVSTNLAAWLSFLSKRDQWRFGVDCIERVLPLYETAFPGDTRARDVIDGLRAYFAQTMTREELDVVLRAFAPAPMEAKQSFEGMIQSPAMASDALSKLFYQAVSAPSHEEISTSTPEGKAKREQLQAQKHAQLTQAMQREVAARKPVAPPSEEQKALYLARHKGSNVASALATLLRDDIPRVCQSAQQCYMNAGRMQDGRMKEELSAQAELLAGYLLRSDWRSLPIPERLMRASKHDTKNVWEQLCESDFALLARVEAERPGWLAASVGAEMVAWAKLLSPKDNEVFALECAARVLPVYEAEHPGDVRGREALEAASKFYRGEISQQDCLQASAQAISASISCRSQASQAAISAVVGLSRIDQRFVLNSGAIATNGRDAFADPTQRQEEIKWQTERLIGLLRASVASPPKS